MGNKNKKILAKHTIEEPEPLPILKNDSVGFWNPFSGVLDWFGKSEPDVDLNKFSTDFDNFHRHFTDLESKLMQKSKMEGYQEIRSYTTYKQMDKNGKVIKADEVGTHYKYNNGEGFVKAVKKMPDGRMHEYMGEFDVMKKLK